MYELKFAKSYFFLRGGGAALICLVQVLRGVISNCLQAHNHRTEKISHSEYKYNINLFNTLLVLQIWIIPIF